MITTNDICERFDLENISELGEVIRIGRNTQDDQDLYDLWVEVMNEMDENYYFQFTDGREVLMPKLEGLDLLDHARVAAIYIGSWDL